MISPALVAIGGDANDLDNYVRVWYDSIQIAPGKTMTTEDKRSSGADNESNNPRIDLDLTSDTDVADETILSSIESIRAAAGVVVASVVVNDRWVRYTILEESGSEHCVGSRVEALVTSGDFAALQAYRESTSR